MARHVRVVANVLFSFNDCRSGIAKTLAPGLVPPLAGSQTPLSHR
jgi:hypothetical protein